MEEIVSASGCPIAGTCCAKPSMAFRGRRILAAAIKRLAALGMSGAEEVLLTGVGFGGTSAILNADFFAEQLKLVADAEVDVDLKRAYFLDFAPYLLGALLTAAGVAKKNAEYDEKKSDVLDAIIEDEDRSN